MVSMRERYKGALLGLAVGDAVGTSVEFTPPGSFEPVQDMTGGGPFDLAPGQWTDDTSMALCLAESLVAKKAFDPVDQMERYLKWYREGYLSSTGECFDIGNTVRGALHRFERSHDPYCGSTDPRSAGNGSLMRLSPVPLAYSRDPEKAIQLSGDSSRTTHGAQSAVDACRYFGGLIVGALAGQEKEVLLSPRYSPVAKGYWRTHALAPKIDDVAAGSFKQKDPPEIQGSGFVVRSLEAALWAFHRSSSFREGCLLAVNLGDDADTTAAVYGQIAGAYYGADNIPHGWIAKLSMRDLIFSLAIQLYEQASR